jgi:arylsulfatase
LVRTPRIPFALRVLAASLALGGALPAAAATDERPDILLIVADDLGYSDLGAFGGEIETPTLDALARRGLVLTNFHAGATCSPTRAMLMTGVDHHRAGLGTMAEALQFNPQQQGQPGYEGHLNGHVVTIASRLNEAGYATRMVGKWHLGYAAADLPSARGFEHSYVLLAGGAHHFDGGRAIPFDPESLFREDGKEVDWPIGRFSTDVYTDRMIDYFESAPADRPLFAYVAYTAPHWPLQAPDEYLEKYAGRYAAGWDAVQSARLARMQQLGLVAAATVVAARPASVPAWADLPVDERAQAARLMEIYAAMVDNLDVNVGRLLDAYTRLDRKRDTVVVFISDNGAEAMMPQAAGIPGLAQWITANFDNSLANLGHRGSYAGYGPGWAHVSNTPFRSFKGSAFEGGVHTPAFVVLPGAAPRRIGEYVHVLDLVPTLLGMAHATAAQDATHYALEGRALLDPAGTAVAADPERITAHELFGHRNVRRGPLKAVSTWTAAGSKPWQLFDVAGDPGEQHDLATSRRADVAALETLYDDWADSHGVIMPAKGAPTYGLE